MLFNSNIYIEPNKRGINIKWLIDTIKKQINY